MYRLLYALVILFSLIPRKIGLRLGEGLGTGLYHLLKRRREIAFRNLTTAFGDQRTEAERWTLEKQCFRGIGRHFFEAVYLFRYDADRIKKYVRFTGVEHYQQAKAQGKGIAFLTGHFGCWELMPISFGYFFEPTYVIVKPLDFEPAEKLSRTLREISGNRVVSKERSMRVLIKLLREKKNLGILMDQNIDWKDGVFVDFFGQAGLHQQRSGPAGLKHRGAGSAGFHGLRGKRALSGGTPTPCALAGVRRPDHEHRGKHGPV